MHVIAAALLVVVALAAGCGTAPPARTAAVGPPPASADPLVGAWSGRWSADGAADGPAELVVAHVPGRADVVGQFTFMAGGVSRSLRYEGRIENGHLRFPLVGEGRIVLAPVAAPRPGAATHLRGDWVDDRGALPAPRGTLELSPAR